MGNARIKLKGIWHGDKHLLQEGQQELKIELIQISEALKRLRMPRKQVMLEKTNKQKSSQSLNSQKGKKEMALIQPEREH